MYKCLCRLLFRHDFIFLTTRKLFMNTLMKNLNLPKRSRYYQGNIDLDLISKGEDYIQLKKSFVILPYKMVLRFMKCTLIKHLKYTK